MSTPTERPARPTPTRVGIVLTNGGLIRAVCASEADAHTWIETDYARFPGPRNDSAYLRVVALPVLNGDGSAAIFNQAEQAATVPLIDTRDGAPITRKDPEVIGYAVADRDGFLVASPSPPDAKAEADRIRDEWTGDLPEGLDWDYRVVGIIELPAEEA